MDDARRDDTDRTRSSRGSRSFIEFARLLASDGDFSRSERIAVLARLIPDQNRALVTRFFLMLTLSVTIAVMGLVANSVAGVSGAGVIGDGFIGDGVIGDGIVGDGVIGDGIIGDGDIGAGVIGDGDIGGGDGMLGEKAAMGEPGGAAVAGLGE